ncbi:hypothetical protein FOL47_002075, partial [Perkinsus chesapeaki]
PLLFVPAIKEDSWMVKLNAIQPEKGPKVAVDGSVVLDTGSNYLYIPQAVIAQLIASISEAASAGAGKEVKVEYDKNTGVWTVACEYRSFMPALHFMLSGLGGNVPLSIAHESYVPETHGYCYLLVAINPKDIWQLPDFMLIGTTYLSLILEYFYEAKVGFGSNPPPPAVSHALLPGLGPDVDERHPSLMKQLLAHPSKPVKENTLALYLEPVSSDYQNLILLRVN